MKTYHVVYIMAYYEVADKSVDVLASNKEEAYDKAVYEAIPKKEGRIPYAAYVASVTYNNGNYKTFNTFIGKAY